VYHRHGDDVVCGIVQGLEARHPFPFDSCLAQGLNMFGYFMVH
jgi:hypothetical protein